jgi:hypothetical protein
MKPKLVYRTPFKGGNSVTRGNIAKAMVVTVAMVLFSIQGWATPIPLPSLSQPSNAGDGAIQTWLISLINAYNTTHNPDLSSASVGAHPDMKVEQEISAPTGYPSFRADTLTITLPGNLNDYLVLHWGGSGGGTFQAFYLPVDTAEAWDVFTAPGQNGLSSYAFYGSRPTSVPEPSTVLLLGAAIVGFVVFLKLRRKKSS